MRGTRASWLAGVVGLAVVAVSIRGHNPVSAGETLANPGFESWSDGKPSGWLLGAGTKAAPETATAVAGTAARLFRGAGAGDGDLIVLQRVDAVPGGVYAAEIYVAGESGTPTATLSLEFQGTQALRTASDAVTLVPPGEYSRISVTATAPAGTTGAVLTLVVQGSPVAAYVDSASLDETAPPATATATPTSTPTPAPTAIATRTPPSSPTPGGSVPTATSTAASSSTTAATPAASPTPAPFGGLLRNGNFEEVDDGRPAAWSKFGGTMELTGSAYRELRAVSLASDTSSTKWVQQLVGVRGGEWYAASAFARLVAGIGEAWVRISWYAAADGSGNAIEHSEGNLITGAAWSSTTTGPVRAPEAANSARVRLMLKPGGPVTVVFDDASLYPASQPEATATPAAASTGTPAPSSATKPPGAPTARPGRSQPVPGQGGQQPPGAGQTSEPLTGPNTLRISEVMSDPSEAGTEAAFEWVELVNAGAEPVDTTGWRFGDSQELDELPAATVPPGGFVVVAGKSATLAAGVAVIRPADGTIGNGLNNKGEALRLVSPDGTEVDTISYGDNTSVFDPAPPAPASGQTIGTLVAGADPDSANWAATLRPTPGQANVFRSVPGAAGGSPAPGTPGTPGTDSSGSLEGDDGSSPVPAAILGAAAFAGLAGAGITGRRLWPRIRERVRGGD